MLTYTPQKTTFFKESLYEQVRFQTTFNGVSHSLLVVAEILIDQTGIDFTLNKVRLRSPFGVKDTNADFLDDPRLLASI